MRNGNALHKLTSALAFFITLISLLVFAAPTTYAITTASGDGLKGFYQNDPYGVNSWNDGDIVNPFTTGTCATDTFSTLTNGWGSGNPAGCNADLFSVYATGYILGPKTGTVNFSGTADDVLVMKIGQTTVISKFGTAGSISGSFDFTDGVVYPIQVWFYENNGTAAFDVKWDATGSASSITSSNLGTTSAILLSSQQQNSSCQIGSSALCPAYSAQEIYNLYGTTTDGNYWILIGGSPTYQYVLMNRSFDSGGWVLAMKGTSSTTKYAYADTQYWTTSGTEYTRDSSGNYLTHARIASNGTGTDAKYESFSGIYGDRIRAIFPQYAASSYGGRFTTNNSYGFIWDEPFSNLQSGAANTSNYPAATYSRSTSSNCSLTKTTLFNLFKNSQRCLFRTPAASYTSSNSNTVNYDPIGSNLFTSQNIFRWWGINYQQPVSGGSPNAYHNARWGFGWNENGTNDEGSNDAIGGIGMEDGAAGSRKTGDYNGCCSTQSGQNTQMAFELYVHHADPNLNAPGTLTATRGGDGIANLSWSAPVGATPNEYVVQYKSSGATDWSSATTIRVIAPSSSPTARITGLSRGTSYDFRVFARTLDMSTNLYDTNSSSSASTYTGYTQLATPTELLVNATSNTEKSLSASWNSVSNASSYTLKLYTDSGLTSLAKTITGLTGTSATINGSNFSTISGNTTYYVTITAIGSGSYTDSAESFNSPATTTLKLATTIDTATVTAGTLKSINVVWDSVPNAVNYTLKIYNSAGTTVLTTLSAVTGTSKTLTTSDYASFSDGTTYQISITANATGNFLAGNESNKSTVTTGIQLIANAPSGSATNGTLKSLDISWTTVANAVSYTLKLYENDGTTLRATVSGITTLTRTINTSDYASFADNTAYKVSITAIGSGSYFNSNESTKTSVTTNATAASPSFSGTPYSQSIVSGSWAEFTVAPSASDGGTVTVQWQYSSDGGTNWINVSTGTGITSNTYRTGTLTYANNNYKYRAAATNTKNGTTSTSYSDAATITIKKADQATLDFSPTTGTYGSTLTLTSSGGSSGEAVTYAISSTNNTAGCSNTNGAGYITFTSAGSCSITATMAGNNDYNSVSSLPKTVTVNPKTLSNINTPTKIVNSYQSMNIDWVAVTNASSYTLRLYSATDTTTALTTFTGLSGTSKTLTTADYSFPTTATQYYVSIQAVGTGNYATSAESTKISVTTLTLLSTPTGVTVSPTPNKGASITVTWSAQANVSTYRFTIYKNSARTQTMGTVFVGDGTATSAVLDWSTIDIADGVGIQNGATYYVAFYAEGDSVSTFDSPVTSNFPVVTYTGLGDGSFSEAAVPTPSTEKSITLKWVLVPYASSYSVKIYSNSNLSTLLQTISVANTSTTLVVNSANFSSIADGTTYYFTVTPIGNHTTYADGAESPSTYAATFIKLSTPSPTVTIPANQAKKITVSWTAILNASSYTITLYNNNAGSAGTTVLGTPATGVSATSYTLTTADYSSMAAATMYWVSVQAVGDDIVYISSAESTKVSGTTNTELTAPTINLVSSLTTKNGYYVYLDPYNSSYTYTASVTAGRMVWGPYNSSYNRRPISVVGMNGGTSSTLTVTVSNGNAVSATATLTTTTSAAALTSGTCSPTLTYSGNYIIAAFQTSGGEINDKLCSWTVPTGVTTAEVVVVGGGGGGGNTNYSGSSGGGGAVLRNGNYALTPGTPISILVGGGGVGANAGPGANGNNSRFDSVLALGGGGGATSASNLNITSCDGLPGGSGGGANTTICTGVGGASYAAADCNCSVDWEVYGNAGGAGSTGSGGGGAGGAGSGTTGGAGKSFLNLTLGAGGSNTTTMAAGSGAGGKSGINGSSGGVYIKYLNTSPATPTFSTNLTSPASFSAGVTKTLTVVATTSDSGTLSYRWQISTNGGTTYSDVSTGSGGTTASYTTPTVETAHNNYKYRVIVTNTINGYTATATSNIATFAVTAAAQSALSISNSPLTGTYGTPITLTTSGGSGNGAVTYAVSGTGNTAGCSVSGDSLSFTSAGSCSVTATKAADNIYSSVSSTAASFTISKANQSTLTIANTSATFGSTFTLTTSGGSGTGAVTYVISGTGNTAGCSNTSSGSVLSFTSIGSCSVTATMPADSRYNSVSTLPTTINVSALTLAAPTVTVSATANTLKSITVTWNSLTGATSYTLKLYSSDGLSTYATILNLSGTSRVVTASDYSSMADNQTYKVSVTAISSGNYNSSPESTLQSVTTTATQSQAQLTIPSRSLSGVRFSTVTLENSGGSGNGAVTYTVRSAGTANCSVSGTTLSYTAVGTCTVYATKAADGVYLIVNSADYTITINAAGQADLTVSPTSGSYGTAITLQGVGGSGTGSITFKLVDAGTAGCSLSGSSLSASSAGNCKVNATKASDSDYMSKTSADTTISFTSTAQLTLTITTTNGTGGSPLTLLTSGGSGTGAITFAVTNGSNTTCSLSGSTLTATVASGNPGTCIVTATKAADSNYLAKSSVATTIYFTSYTVTVTATSTCTPGTLGSTSNTNCQSLTTPTGSAPKISSLSVSSGSVGATITITGTSFTGLTKVQFGTKLASTFTVVSDTSATAVVPSGATTGRILVANSYGSGMSSVFTVIVADTQAPILSAASVVTNTPNQIVLTFDENLASTSIPTSAFAVTVAGSIVSVSSVTISGSQVTLTLASAVSHGQAVAFTYTNPADLTSLQDSSGNKTSTIGNTAATNNVP